MILGYVYRWLDRNMYMFLSLVCAILIPFMLYLFHDAASFGLDGKDKFTALDRFYFSVVTFTTVGFGDLTPKTPFLKVVVSVQALLAPFILGVFLNKLANTFSEKMSKERQERDREWHKEETRLRTRRERGLEFDRVQRTSRNIYRSCVNLYYRLEFEHFVLKPKDVCFATTQDHCMVLNTIFHDKTRTEEKIEKLLLEKGDHILSCGKCTEWQIKYLENIRYLFASEIERIYIGECNRNPIKEDVTDLIAGILSHHDRMKLYATNILDDTEASEPIKLYFEEWWQMFDDIDYLLRKLEAPDIVTVADPCGAIEHPFADLDIEKWIMSDWNYSGGIRITRRLGETFTPR